jgi:serine/threonine protein kinase
MSGDGELIGAVLDERWEVLELIGRGGMGEVYRARHRHLGTDVAIKVLTNTAGLSPSDVARFYRESELIGKLNHDHIIRVQDTGKTASGKHFFVMEYLRGPNLRMLLRDGGPLSWARTRVIVSQLCDALSAIHSSGVIHRDLKLQNIVLDPRRGRPDFVKLLDFGVAKSLSDDGQPLTQTGIVLGTLAYMAPEYLLGYPPDGRVDIYALGVIAFELLTGRLPTPNSATNLTLLQSQGVPAGAHEVVVRAMMRDPAQRFGDAEAFAAALAASPDGASPGLDESTTTRFVGPTHSESNGHIDAVRMTWSPPEALHAPAPTAIKVDDNRPPPAPSVPEPVIPAAAHPLPQLEGIRGDSDEVIDAVGSVEMAPASRGSTGATLLSAEAPVPAPTDSAVPEPQRPSIPPVMPQAPILETSPERPAGPPDGAQAEVTAKPPAATAAPARPNAAPKLIRRALYALIVVSPAVLLYTLIPAPSGPKPDTIAAISPAGGLRMPGTGLGEVNTSKTSMPPVPEAVGGSADDSKSDTVIPDTNDTTESTDGGTKGGGLEAPPPPPPPEKRPPMTGRLSYKNKLSEVKRVVKSCKVFGASALKLSIVIDGKSGKAKAKVLEPALVKDQNDAKCAVDNIAMIKFETFTGTHSPEPTFFDLGK